MDSHLQLDMFDAVLQLHFEYCHCPGYFKHDWHCCASGLDVFIMFVLLVVYSFYWAWPLLQMFLSSRQPQAEVRSSRQDPRRQASSQQQAALMAAMQRQHQPSPATLCPVSSTSAGASAVSVWRVPLDGSTSRPRFAMAR